MKKLLIFTIFLLINTITYAQEKKGIDFESGLNWSKIKEKAKKENKYIFVDGYTTWCAPCLVMASTIFTQANVGDFFNRNFINVKIQFDKSISDESEVKNWYNEAKNMKATYKISSYPTYLFFDSEGSLVHKILGASPNAQQFILKAKEALKPATQLNTLKHQYDLGKKDPKFLLSLIKAAQQANDEKFIPVVINDYLATQSNLLTTDNIKLISIATSKSTDPGFKVLREHPKLVDSIFGKGKTNSLVKNIAFDEVMLPYLNAGREKTHYGAGMIVYEGKPRAYIDWEEAKKNLLPKYGDLADEIVLEAKPFYYRQRQNWPQFTEAVSTYVYKLGNSVNMDKVDSYANDVFLFSEDTTCINAAINWSKKIFSETKDVNLQYLYTLGCLLYKSGKTELGITAVQEVLSKTGGKNQRFIKTIAKMKNGEKTW